MLRLDPLFPVWLVAVLAASAAGATLWAYRGASRQLGRRAGAWASALRVVAIVLVALCMLRPRLVRRTVLHQKSRCAVLVDVSRSMGTADEAEGRTRLEAAEAVLRDHERLWSRLRLRYDVKFYTFAERADQVEEPAALEAVGNRTDMDNALIAAARGFRGAEAAGILLLGDGNYNTTPDLASSTALLRSARVPVFAIGLGAQTAGSGLADVEVRSVDCAPRSFVGNRLPVSAHVHYVGPRRERIPVVLLEDDKEVDRQLVTLPAGEHDKAVSLGYVTRTLGVHRLTVKADPLLGGESNAKNNRASSVVSVSAAKLVAFYLEGRIRPEFKFIRRSVGAARSIQLLAENAYLAGPRGIAAVLPDEDAWKRINVFILGDVPADSLGPKLHERLRQFVSEGGALLMIGGFESFGAGKYAGTRLAGPLPVRVSSTDGHREGAVAARLTAEGAKHPITRLAETPAENARVWASLPLMQGLNRVGDAKPLAKVLLESAEGDPILVVQDYGRGRCAALTVDTTWRWAFSRTAALDEHRRFWRQLVLWLARSDYARSHPVSASTDRTRYRTGDPVTVEATVHRTCPEMADAEITASVQPPSGKPRVFRMGRGTGTHRLPLPTPAAEDGEYRLTVEARTPGGKLLGSDTTGFIAYTVDAEARPSTAQLHRLTHLAHRTGGEFFTAAEAGTALEHLLNLKPPAKLTRPDARPLFGGPLAFSSLLLLFVAALTGDWLLRKSKGLA